MSTKSIKYIKVKEAARILRCSDSHVYNLVKKGVFTRYPISETSYRLDRAEVTAYPLGKLRASNKRPIKSNHS